MIGGFGLRSWLEKGGGRKNDRVRIGNGDHSAGRWFKKEAGTNAISGVPSM